MLATRPVSNARAGQALRHPNILLFMGACTLDPRNLAIVTEYLAGGSLWDALHDPAFTLDWRRSASALRPAGCRGTR